MHASAASICWRPLHAWRCAARWPSRSGTCAPPYKNKKRNIIFSESTVMSWFYEALVRAEAKPRDDEKVGVGTVAQGGESFLSEIEALSPTLVSARESTLEAAPSPASKVLRASGFRHL